MVDENYHFREPAMIALKKGWNHVLVKSPTTTAPAAGCHLRPVQMTQNARCNVKEFPGLKFSTDPGRKP